MKRHIQMERVHQKPYLGKLSSAGAASKIVHIVNTYTTENKVLPGHKTSHKCSLRRLDLSCESIATNVWLPFLRGIVLA